MRIGGDDRAGLVADSGVMRRGGGEEGIEEIGIAVAHESEDLIDVLSESGGDMRRGMSHGRPFADEIWKNDPCMSHTRFFAASCSFFEHRLSASTGSDGETGLTSRI